MYSVVLMMALTGSAETPDFGGRCRCACSSGCACSSSCGHCGRGGHCGGLFNRCHGGGRCACRCNSGCACSHRCHGGCHSACHGCCGGVVAPTGGMKDVKKTEMAAPATIVVSLPAEAKLMIDGNATTSTSARRVFTSPALDMGQEYIYTLRAEIVRDGQTVAETQTVTVRAGAEIPVQFALTSQGVATR